MKKILFKIALMAVMLVPLALAVPAQAASISVGNDTVYRPSADGYENFTVIDTNHPVSANGWLTVFNYYAMDKGPFGFILVDGSNVVKWVSEEITPPAEEAVNVFTPASAVEVQAGWNLGVYFFGTGTIPFESTGSPAYFTPDGWVEPPAVQTPAVPTVGSILTYESSANRTYSFVATGVADDGNTQPPAPPQAVSVTVVKYLDGQPAGAVSANNSYFLMNETWSNTNTGSSGSGRFALGPVGVNTTNPYQATFANLTSGAAYSLSEDTSQYAVGTICSNGQVYQLLGYKIVNNLTQAAAAPLTPTASLTNITSNKFIIVWNQTCAQTQTIQVGNDTAPRPILDTFGNFAIYDTNHPVSGNGWLTSFHYYAANGGAIRFLLVDGSDMVQWVSDEITPPGVGVNMFTPASPVPVRKGWNVGVYFVSNGTIPYEYTGAPAYYRTNNSGSVLPIVGNTFGYENYSNRTYSFAATGETVIPPPQTVNVTIVKYLDGTRADAVSANNTSFPMNATWKAANISPGYGSGSFVLGPAANNTNPYQATTPDMTRGASYGVSEDTTQSTVGTSCKDGQLYQLVGYSTGDTLVQAVLASQTTRNPSLTNIVSDKYVIVWNETCATDDDDCDHHDNGHHYGNDKGDNHHSPKDKCRSGDNGHHYGNDKGDNHQSPKDKDKDKKGKGKDGGKR